MENTTSTLTIRLPQDLKIRLQMFCEKNDLTTSQVVRQLLKADYRLQAIKPPAAAKPTQQQKRRK